MRLVILLLTTIFALAVSESFSGSPFLQSDMKFDRISVEQGLSNFTVSSITQDKYGFLWFSTEDGLNHYDGYTFTIYRHIEGDSTSLPGSLVSRAYVDRRGVLWACVVDLGISRFDPLKKNFKNYTTPWWTGPPTSVNVSSFFEDDAGRLWLCTNRGIWQYVRESDSFSQFVHDSRQGEVLAHAAVKVVDVDSEGVWWIVTFDRGLFSYDPNSNRLRRYNSDVDRQLSPLDTSLIAVCADVRGDVWIGTLKGLYRYRTSTGTLENFRSRFKGYDHLFGGIILDVSEDSRGNIWIGTFHGGLYRYIPSADTFLNFRHDPDDPRSLVSNRIENMFEDMTGGIWFSSYRAGLNKYTPVSDPFFRFRTGTARRPGIAGESVYTIAQDSSGNILFGTNEQGLSLFDPATGSYAPHPAIGAPRHNTLAVAVDRKGTVWASQGTLLKKLEPGTGRFVTIPLRGARPFAYNAQIKTLKFDHAGNLWIGMDEGGLLRMDAGTQRFRHYRHDVADSTSLPWPSIWCVFEDSKRNIWVGSFGGGIARYNPASDNFTRFVSRQDDPYSLSGQNIYSITEDADGYLWIGTFARGLNRFNPTDGSVRRYFERDGLPNNFVKVALPDGEGNLWISTDRGISKFELRNSTFTNFSVADGLHGDVFLSGAYCKTAGGMMIFGGNHGATAFFPSGIAKIQTPPPIVFTSFQVFDSDFPLDGPINDVSLVRLSHDQNFVSFEFSALDYTASGRNRYKYMMTGLDTGWVEAGTRRFARYTHMPPGEFVFRVIGANKDGVWNEHGRSIALVIAPPYWQTWWFRGAAVLVFVGIGAVLYNYRVNRLLEIERLRVRIASDLHDDIGSSLTKISLQSELIQEGVEPEERENYLKNIASMSRELVQSMSDIVWSIDARNDTVENLLDKMKSFASSTLAAKEIGFTFAHSGLEPKKRLPVDVRENLYLIFKEAINNIARHAGATSVSVILRNDSDKFTMVVVDDGKGWEGEQRPSGHGTRNMKMRAERLGGSIDFVRDNGTRVVLAIKRV